jgi:hypothetical protein
LSPAAGTAGIALTDEDAAPAQGHHCAATAMPDRPAFSEPLTHPGLVLRITGAAQRLGYDVI